MEQCKMMNYAKVLALAGFVVAACGGASGFGNNSETHFLGYCDDDECGDGLSCVCGVCTVTCDPAASCSELNVGAVCRSVSDADAMSCGEQSQPSVCDVECNTKADCSSVSAKHECVAGFCRLPGCVYQGRVYPRGETFPAPGAEDCNSCTCGNDGQVVCTRAACLPTECEYAGATYAIGDTFPSSDGCNTCSCMETGTVGCTLIACASRCEYDGTSYDEGDTFFIECNACTCGVGGQISCDDRDCSVSCDYDGITYYAGDVVPVDDCNTCTCEASGIVCTDRACAESCEYNGVSYPDGAMFPASDGCNSCSCEAGSVLCTEIGCDICQLPFEVGPCDAAFQVYWHNPDTGACEERIYGGCEGNDNRFETLDACEAACSG